MHSDDGDAPLSGYTMGLENATEREPAAYCARAGLQCTHLT